MVIAPFLSCLNIRRNPWSCSSFCVQFTTSSILSGPIWHSLRTSRRPKEIANDTSIKRTLSSRKTRAQLSFAFFFRKLLKVNYDEKPQLICVSAASNLSSPRVLFMGSSGSFILAIDFFQRVRKKAVQQPVSPFCGGGRRCGSLVCILSVISTRMLRAIVATFLASRTIRSFQRSSRPDTQSTLFAFCLSGAADLHARRDVCSARAVAPSGVDSVFIPSSFLAPLILPELSLARVTATACSLANLRVRFCYFYFASLFHPPPSLSVCAEGETG